MIQTDYYKKEFTKSIKTPQDKVEAFIKDNDLVRDIYMGCLWDIHMKPNELGIVSIGVYNPTTQEFRYLNDSRYEEYNISLSTLED